MKHELFFAIAIFLNVLVSLLYPSVVGMDDPLGIDGIRTQKFNSLSSNDQKYFIENGVFDENGNPTGEYKTKIEELNAIGDGEAGLIITELSFGFLDFVKVVLRSIQSILTFFIAFLVLLYNLSAPFNILLGVPMGILYVYSTGRLIMGR
jgi:hypothetical protein